MYLSGSSQYVDIKNGSHDYLHVKVVVGTDEPAALQSVLASFSSLFLVLVVFVSRSVEPSVRYLPSTKHQS